MFALIFLHIYFVSFLDKPEKTVPQLSPRAIEQRDKWDIPTDQMDYPVSQLYQNNLRKMGVKILHVSRWFNGATCEMNEELAAKVAKEKYVTDVELTRETPVSEPDPLPIKRKEPDNMTMSPSNAETPDGKGTVNQLQLFNLLPLHEAGYEGQGILMAFCDGGFGNADQLPCFRQKELHLGSFDLTDDTTDFYNAESGSHGTACLSIVSGIDKENAFYGAATKAQYYLLRSEEVHTESPKEMDNLVVALEKADSLGVNVFSVSLGYYFFDSHDTLPKEALDGRTTRASLAATIAARKGMLVCVAAGNEGNKIWHSISVPADADSIITVGAVGLDSVNTAFSSYGPSADGRIKPEVCALGQQTTIIRPSGEVKNGNGTSYATPLIAGLAAALWSALPDENAMQIRERIIRSTDRYSFPDKGQYGYGIPNAWKAYTMKREESSYNGQWLDEQPRKIIRGEQILIIRHGHVYNLAGQRLE